MGKGILVITFVLQQINLTGYILPPRKSVSLSPCTYIIASLSKPLDKEIVIGLASWACHALRASN